ncbi:MAG: polysaccharide pyruvyl transferase CsaB, partial [Chroococcales cyanobacterium]
MGQRRAVLCGYYGKGNAGDEALLASVLQMLPDSITPFVLSGNPQETRQRYDVECGDRFSTWTVLKALKASDLFIWGGGSLMQDATSIRNPLYYGGLMAFAQQRGLKTIAWAQGIGPLNTRFSRWMTQQVLTGCAGISVRDRISAQLVSDWQLSVKMAPDPVWALEAKPIQDVWRVPTPRIAVCLRSHSQLTQTRLNTLTQALIDFQN